MALNDRDIIITPNRGAASEPNILFRGADAGSSATISLRVYNSGTVGTLSFEGSSGQLLSITDTMSGSIFSVNDISGIPSIEVFDTGEVRLAQYNGYVDILNPVPATSTNSGALQVVGGVGIGGNLYVGGTIFGVASVTGVITTATNIAGGAANQIHYQTAPGVTGFVTAPSSAGTALVWNGSGYVWQTASGGNASGLLTLQSGTNATRFLTFVDNNFATASTSSFYTDAGVTYNPSTNDLSLTGALIVSPTTLGSTLGNTSTYQSLRGSNGNTNFLDITMIRDSNGADWTTAGTRIQQKIDSTWMAYQQFNGTSVNGGIEWGSGTTTTSPQTIAARMRLDSSGILRILTNTNASSTITGALQVVGGVGIGGNLYVGGTIYGVGGSAITPTVNFEAIATGGQTTFTIPSGYTVGYIEVFANGILLGSSNYTASNGTTVVLNNARNAGDIVRVVAAAAGGTVTAFNGGTITNNLVINAATQATSTTTGALQVTNGGAGIGGDIYSGGTIYQRGTSLSALSAALAIALGA
jgi:hypothetical protein